VRVLTTCSRAQCSRIAKGSSGLCPSHGGGAAGRQCQQPGCQTPAKEGGLCKAHGGGVRCGIVGCSKSSQEGGLCIAHGGGRGCKAENCDKLAKHGGLCISHGGGTRCKETGCAKSAQARGLCKAHGGGSKCKEVDCLKFAQSHGLCSHHGGGKRCSERGCRRLAKNAGGGLCPVHHQRLGRVVSPQGPLPFCTKPRMKKATPDVPASQAALTKSVAIKAETSEDIVAPLLSLLEPRALLEMSATAPEVKTAVQLINEKSQCCKANCTERGGVCRALLLALGHFTDSNMGKSFNAKRKHSSIVYVG